VVGFSKRSGSTAISARRDRAHARSPASRSSSRRWALLLLSLYLLDQFPSPCSVFFNTCEWQLGRWIQISAAAKPPIIFNRLGRKRRLARNNLRGALDNRRDWTG